MIRSRLAERILGLKEESVEVTLALISVGDLAGSVGHVKRKSEACSTVGIKPKVLCLPEHTSPIELRAIMGELSINESVDGMLVPLPLPTHLIEQECVDIIPIEKDVDGLTTRSLGLLL